MKKKLSIKLVVISMAMMLYTCAAVNNLHPLILIPGTGGNQLEGKLTSDYKPSSLLCKRREGKWFRLWFDLSVLLAPLAKCFVDRMTLYYNPVVDDYHNAPGVQTRVSHFGSTQSLLYLNPSLTLKHLTEYMAPLVDALEGIGYVDGKNLFGAPYDFRYGLAAEGHPSQVGTKFLQDLKELIEEASNSNGGKPVILLTHSLGSHFALQLLNRNPPTWRSKFIKHFVALSAPWGGSMEATLTFASGYSLGVPFVNPLVVRDEQRSSESNLWLLPNPKIFGHSKPIVVTQSTNYSAYDIPQFLIDIGFPQGVYPYETRILPLIQNITAPKVPVTCIVGKGVKTPETLFYWESNFDKQPEILYGDGDGTVNMRSLLALESLWAGEENQRLKVIRIEGVSHSSVLKDKAALDELLAEISGINYFQVTTAVV
ncbi:lecithin-cholesterol acyltransferase-like 1 [Quillaja saponaria]|uniref:Lecithin-cholesterol acyltransferase-like 1 n=1 Tax=Quillaja saponaria TaxID=32244 RepID=A0AAD7LYA4_QUISA|nr:lecithin-cholesterol acyltransferase-like 1 [Quillaja saponaria]